LDRIGEYAMIDTKEALRENYPEPKARALDKQLSKLDTHCRRFIGLSPFLVLATTGKDGRVDASPRGGAPGFVRVIDDHTLCLPDALGNNRLDSFTNIVETGRCGMIFFVPGIDEALRINGTAKLCNDANRLAAFPHERHPPRMVVEIGIEEAYLHCPKALMRSKLWSADHRVDRASFPSMGQMIKDQSGMPGPVETQEEALKRYATEL
jgi:PPOX class probable FMN-dependent enzyme